MDSRITLLVADDETAFLSHLTRHISLRDFDVCLATSPAAALALAQVTPFGLALLHLPMLGEAGAEVIQLLSAAEPCVELLWLGDHGEPSRTHGIESYGVLSRTIDPAGLLRALKDSYARYVKRKHRLTDNALSRLLSAAASESPVSVLRKLRALDARRPRSPVDKRAWWGE